MAATATYAKTNQYGDIAQSNAGPPVTMGPTGFWLDKNGNVAATDQAGKPQVTPGMRDNPQAAIYYDAAKDLNYNVVNGTKVYQSPVTYDANGNTIFKKSLKSGPISDTGGGLVHGRPQWNPQTGTWDVGLDWGKVLSWAAAAGISAGVINAAMAPAAAASSGATAGIGVGGVEAGATAGLDASVASGALAGGAEAGLGGASAGVGAGTAAFDAAGNFIGPSTVSGASSGVGTAAGGAVAGGTSLADILRYGVPTAGGIVGGIIQANASGAATTAQQKYLEEALAYQKEQDAYNRTRQATLDAQNVSRYNYGRDQEASRYANYSGNIAPYIATGQTANERMAGLLGLPAPPPMTANAMPPAGGSRSGPNPIGTGQNFDPTYIGTQLDAIYAKHGLTATGPGTGPTDKAYMIDAVRKSGGWDQGYWEDRLPKEFAKVGIGGPPMTTASPNAAPPSQRFTTQPLPRVTGGDTPPTGATSYPPNGPTRMITIQAPNGQTKQVPASEQAHWESVGGKVIGAAA